MEQNEISKLKVTLYLDYDGVLHEASRYLTGIEYFVWTPILIKALMPYPHVEIVLSTSWTRNRGFDRALAYLPVDLQRRVVGATFEQSLHLNCRYDSSSRFEQIYRHAERGNLSRWLAIDDLFEGSEQWDDAHSDKLILTDPMKGLSDPAALERLKKLLESAHIIT